ncbi:MAG TPA: hypothetical protein VMZ06_10085 [Candidatus Bathyarchaeia archaeon]|nr:hypothetical protein [Candidatus Bathyarchaeia archaeon]
MKIVGRVVVALLVSAVVVACQPSEKQTGGSAPTSSASDTSKVVGNWNGVLDAQGQKFELLFKLTAGPDGIIKASIDSVSQGVNDIPVEETSLKGDHLILEAKSILGVLDVTLQDGNILRGKWNQAGVSYPLELKRVK